MYMKYLKEEKKRVAIIGIIAAVIIFAVSYEIIIFQEWTSVIFFAGLGVFTLYKAVRKKKNWKISLILFMFSLLLLSFATTWVFENINASVQVIDNCYNVVFIIAGCNVASLIIAGIAALVQKLR